MSLDHVRELWLQERPRYEQLSLQLVPTLRRELGRLGVKCQVDSRVKTVASLVRKFIRKGYVSYDRISDKLGVRVVVNMLSQVSLVEQALQGPLKLTNKQNKLDELEPDRLGYLSIHYDTLINPFEGIPEEYWNLPVEVQVRSMCQDIWAQMAHSMIYKPSVDAPPKEVSRRVYALGALLEICDREFESLYQDLMSRPEAWPRVILDALQESFYRLCSEDFDQELSLQVIEHLKPVLDVFFNQERFSSWAEENDANLRIVYAKYRTTSDRWVFLYQPESLLLFFLMEVDKYALLERWSSRFPFEELEGIANAWGTSLC